MPKVKITIEGDDHYVSLIAAMIGPLLDAEEILDEEENPIDELTYTAIDRPGISTLEVEISEVPED